MQNNPRTKQRQNAKKERGKGQSYIKSKGLTEEQFAQQNDPLFKIKGIERHLKRKGIING